MTEIFYDQAQGLRELVKNTGNKTSSEDVLKKTQAIPKQAPQKLITVSSGKGGVGKSTIAVNLAIALQQLGIKVLVIDADFGLANIDVMLGAVSKANLNHFIQGEKTLAQVIQKGRHNVSFISGGSGIYELMNLKRQTLNSLIDDLLVLEEPVDIIIFDTGAGINDKVLNLVLSASEVILVATPEPTAILDAYALLKTATAQGLAGGYLPYFRLIMNKGETRKEAEKAIKGFQNISRKYLNQEVDALGSVIYDSLVSRSIKDQVPLIINSPESAAAQDIFKIAQALANCSLPLQSGDNPVMKLFNKFFK